MSDNTKTASCDEMQKLKGALREIATCEGCTCHTWTKYEDPPGYRNTCCMEIEKDSTTWCVQCVAAHALGWDTDKFVFECAGPSYLGPEALALVVGGGR